MEFNTGRARLIRTHLIQSSTLFEVSVKCFPFISCLKCTVNSNFHLIRRKSLLMNDFKLTVSDLYKRNKEQKIQAPLLGTPLTT